MVLKSKANIDYKFECHLLQEAAKKDKFDSSSCTLSSETVTHHKRANSKDVQEQRKLPLPHQQVLQQPDTIFMHHQQD